MSSIICLMLLLMGTWEATSVTLTSSPSYIGRNGSPGFYLKCDVDTQPNDGDIVNVRWMSIVKMDTDKDTPVVEVDANKQTPDITATGVEGDAHFNKRGPSSLKATWILASRHNAGMYVCQIVGYSARGHLQKQRSPIVYVENEPPLDLYELLHWYKLLENKTDAMFGNIMHIENWEKNFETVKERIQTLHYDLNQTTNNIQKMVAENKANLGIMKYTHDDLRALHDQLRAMHGGVPTDHRLQSEETQHSQWPSGFYALLQPQSGCPRPTGVFWTTGWIKHHTEAKGTVNVNAVSNPAHMKTPIMQRKGMHDFFMTQYHCIAAETSTSMRSWPAGSYCVMAHGNKECPSGFKVGTIKWDGEISELGNSFSGIYACNKCSRSVVVIQYCCRNDGLPTRVIRLPSQLPFYLYRIGGTCQLVHDMKVTPEFMLFGTENPAAGNKFVGHVPDGSTLLPNIKLELCYYEPLFV